MPKYVVDLLKLNRSLVMRRSFEHQGVPTFDEFEQFGRAMAEDSLWDGLVEMGERIRLRYKRDTTKEHEIVFGAPWVEPDVFEETFEEAAEEVPEWATRFEAEVEKMREIADFATEEGKVTQKMLYRLISFRRSVERLVNQDENRH